MAVAGYNVAFRIGLQTIAGRTQDDLTVAARTRERLTKDDEGATQVAITGHDITIRATALVVVDDETNITRDDLLAMSLLTSEDQDSEFEFFYTAEGGDSYTGTCVITNFSESSNASDDATLTVDFRVNSFTKVTPAPISPNV